MNMSQKNGNEGERGCLLWQRREGELWLRPSQGTVSVDRINRLTTFGDRREIHLRRSAEGGAGMPQPAPTQEASSTCSVELTLNPSPQLPGKKLGPVVAR